MSIAHFRLLLNNRDATGEYVRQGIKWSAVEKLVAEWDALEARVAAQEPEPPPPQIVDRDTPAYTAMRNAGIDRIKEQDGAAFVDIDIAVRARQEAHGRISQ